MQGKAISFEFTNTEGNTVTAEDLRGSPYVLYFYPKDDTPGCTTEACGIRDAWADFAEHGLKVFGVSKDDAQSHQKFVAKYDLPFPLLTASGEQLEALGVWKEKNLYGKKFWGINRETFLVGDDGTVLKHYKRVKPAEHAQQLLDDYQALATA